MLIIFKIWVIYLNFFFIFTGNGAGDDETDRLSSVSVHILRQNICQFLQYLQKDCSNKNFYVCNNFYCLVEACLSCMLLPVFATCLLIYDYLFDFIDYLNVF